MKINIKETIADITYILKYLGKPHLFLSKWYGTECLDLELMSFRNRKIYFRFWFDTYSPHMLCAYTNEAGFHEIPNNLLKCLLK